MTIDSFVTEKNTDFLGKGHLKAKTQQDCGSNDQVLAFADASTYIANQCESYANRFRDSEIEIHHCLPSRTSSREEKPWMLLMLGGSGAGKGTFLRATWLNFRYLFFGDIFVWVKSICLV